MRDKLLSNSLKWGDFYYCVVPWFGKANNRNINKQKGWPDRDTNRVYLTATAVPYNL